MIELEQYFKGQKKWKEYSSIFGDDWIDSDYQKLLLFKLDNRIDLAKVIYYHIRETSLDWLNKKIPALDELTPLQCLESEKTIDRLKACLMRMQ